MYPSNMNSQHSRALTNGNSTGNHAPPEPRQQSSHEDESANEPTMRSVTNPPEHSTRNMSTSIDSNGPTENKPSSPIQHTSPELRSRIAKLSRHGHINQEEKKTLLRCLDIADSVADTQMLFEAIRKNDRKKIRSMATRNSEILKKTLESGDTPLMHAVQHRAAPKTIKLMLKLCPESINLQNLNGQTALHFAVSARNSHNLHALLEAGASLGICMHGSKSTPLHDIVKTCPSELPKALEYADKTCLNVQDVIGKTALHFAAYYSVNDSTKALLDAGADPRISSKGGRTPLWYAVAKGATANVLLLSRYDKGALIHQLDPNGNTPLHIASHFGQDESITILIKAGAEVNKLNANGMSPLGIAAARCNYKTIELFRSNKGTRLFVGPDMEKNPAFILLTREDKKKYFLDMLSERWNLGFDPKLWQELLKKAIRDNNANLLRLVFDSKFISQINYAIRTDTCKYLIEYAVKHGTSDKTLASVIRRMCEHFKKIFNDDLAVSSILKPAFHLATRREKWELLCVIARSVKRLNIDPQALYELIEAVVERGDYVLLDALSKISFVSKNNEPLRIDSSLLSDPLAREVWNEKQASPLEKASTALRTLFKGTHELDTIALIRKLAEDIKAADASAQIQRTLEKFGVSGLLASTIIDLITGLLPALNFVAALPAVTPSKSPDAFEVVTSEARSLARAPFQLPPASDAATEYLLSYCLAGLTHDELLLAATVLANVPNSAKMIDDAKKQRATLVTAGSDGLAKTHQGFGHVTLAGLIELTSKAMNESPDLPQYHLASALGTQFGLLPIWANRMAAICIAAYQQTKASLENTVARSAMSRNEQAVFAEQISLAFNHDRRRAALPEGFNLLAESISNDHLEQFNDLVYQQWDSWVEIFESAIAQVAAITGIDRHGTLTTTTASAMTTTTTTTTTTSKNIQPATARVGGKTAQGKGKGQATRILRDTDSSESVVESTHESTSASDDASSS